MKTGKRWSSWLARFAWLLILFTLPAHVAGCAKDRNLVEKSLMGQRPLVSRETVRDQYRVACPDAIDVQIGQRPELSGTYAIGADGRIDLGDYGNPRLEGRTLPETAQIIAQEVGTTPTSVEVRVSNFRSQHLLLFGEVIGQQRRVPYQGQETVLDLLQRVGGITAGAEPKDVYVVRPHLDGSRRHEVFHVDLQGIVMKDDHRTNIRLLPYDQIYVGETRQAQIEKVIPPWLRGVYATFSGTPRTQAAESSRSRP